MDSSTDITLNAEEIEHWGMRRCAYTECEKWFKKNHKQRYCSENCQRISYNNYVSPKIEVAVKCSSIKCTNEFLPKRPDHLYCSRKCKERSARNRRKTRGIYTHICRGCGIEYKSNRKYSLYHNIDCRNKFGKKSNKGNYLVRKGIINVDEYLNIMSLIGNARSRAKENEMEYNLDAEWAKKQSSIMFCPYTGIKFKIIKNNNKVNPLSRSIHRINCDQGYTKENVIIICSWANLAISNFGEELFFKMCKVTSCFRDKKIID